MVSIVHKTVGGQTYYYLREMARVGGKPKMVSQRYLGKASDIEAAMDGAMAVPERTRHLAFGDLAAVWSILERLEVAAIVDDVVGARRSDAAASVGTYMALAAANRVVKPCSKLGFGEWWATTAGDRWVRVPAAAMDHRRFWDAMHAIDGDALVEIERRLVDKMVTEFGLDLSGLVLDMTNFATYIDSANDRADIAQRGHAKQKRTDLRLVGLGLVVSVDGGIPICSHAYAGNKHDVTQFAEIVTEVVATLGGGGKSGDEFTLVYDAGQDSEANQAHIEATPLHFIGWAAPLGPPGVAGREGSPLPAGRRGALSGADRLRYPRRGLGRGAAPDRDPLGDVARQTSPGIRPDPGGRPPPAGPSWLSAWPAGKPARTAAASKPRSPRSSSPAGCPGSSPAPCTATARPASPCNGVSTPRPSRPSPTSCSANASCSPTTTTGRSSSRGRLPLPIRGGRRFPANERPARRCRSARCSTGPTTTSGSTPSTACSPSPWPGSCAAKPPTRPGHERAGTSGHPRRPAGNRAPLPINGRPTQGPAHAHRDRPHPTTAL